MSTVIVVSNPAPRGPAGKTILSGTGAPTVEVGDNGDFYFDETNSLFYGPKAAGVWPPPIPVGSVNFADQAEVDAGVEAGKAITPDTYQQGLTNRVASQAEAEAGTEATKLMTPERVAQAIAVLGSGAVYASQAEADAGTESAKAISPNTLQNAITNRTASQAEAEAGAENTRMMTPLRVAQAIAALGGGGGAPFASQAEVDAGAETAKTVSPATFQQGITNRKASQAEAEAGTDNDKVMTPLRVAEAIAALGGGGGGAAYPDTATVHSTQDEVINLTTSAADQGIHAGETTGIVLNLPSAAANGVTYKVIAGPGNIVVNATGGAIFYPFINTVFRAQPGRIVTLVALNLSILSPTLVWVCMEYKPNITWESNVTYAAGEIVNYSGEPYISKQNLNTNNTPDAAFSNWWMALTSVSQASNSASIVDTDVTVNGGTPPVFPSGAVGYLAYFVSGNLKRITVVLDGIITPGAGNSNLHISLTGARGLDPNIPTFNASDVVPVLVIPTGSGAVPCIGTFGGTTDIINVTFPAPVNLSGISSATLVW